MHSTILTVATIKAAYRWVAACSSKQLPPPGCMAPPWSTTLSYNAQNIFAAIQQSETPYWQGRSTSSYAPAPWTVNYAIRDPDFSGCGGDDWKCRMAWLSHAWGGSHVFLYGPGFWTFFNNNGGCDGYCKTNAVEVGGGVSSLYYYGITTKLNENLVRDIGKPSVTEYINPGSWGGCVAAFLTHS